MSSSRKRRTRASRAATLPAAPRRPWWIAALGVAVVTALVFLPAVRNGFVTWDDDKNFVNNPHFRGLGPDQLHWMWSTFRLGHYVPLSWMTLGLDYTIWGMDPLGYHLTNVLLHGVNAGLLFLLSLRLFRLAAPQAVPDSSLRIASMFSAFFYALHPLRVESVAWVTERRDVLSLLFMLACTIAYLRAGEPDSDARYARRWYVAAVALFLAALLSKATAMSLPAVLLILEVYPLRRLGGTAGWWSEHARRTCMRIAPFAVLSLASILLSIIALHPPAQLGITQKVGVSSYAFTFYVWKTLVPRGLAPLYQMPENMNVGGLPFVRAYVAVAVFIAGVIAIRRRWPALVACAIAYTVIVLPMVGVVQNGPQIAADRYTYHAGPAMALAAGAMFLAALVRWRLATVGIAIVVLIGETILTERQITVWHDSDSLWTRVLAEDAFSSIGNTSYASVLLARDDVDGAVRHAKLAVKHGSRDPQAHTALGIADARQDRLPAAVRQFQAAIALAPRDDEAETNWGIVAARMGNLDEAVAHFTRALSINPDNADAQVNWGNALVRASRLDEAIGHYRLALEIRPDHEGALFNWGVALAQENRLAEAVDRFRAVLAIDPGHREAAAYLEKATQMLQAGPAR